MLKNQNDLRKKIISIILEKFFQNATVAQAAGFTTKEFTDLIKGKKAFKTEYIPQICKALDVTPNELFCYNKDESDN